MTLFTTDEKGENLSATLTQKQYDDMMTMSCYNDNMVMGINQNISIYIRRRHSEKRAPQVSSVLFDSECTHTVHSCL